MQLRRCGISYRSLLAIVAMLALLVAAACGVEDDDAAAPVDEVDEVDDVDEVDEVDEEPDVAEDDADVDEEADADDYPSESITYIIMHDPGGGTDGDFRRMQPHLEEILGVSLEAEYILGAGGNIGWAELANNREPDGYTIGAAVFPNMHINVELQDEAGYDMDALDYISGHVEIGQALSVNATNPAWESFEDFMEDVEANPGARDISTNLRNASHAIQVMMSEQGLETNHVVAQGGAAEAITNVLGGHVQGAITSADDPIGNEELEPIVYFGEERHPLLPDVPTPAEFGYEGLVSSIQWGIAGPAGIPEERKQVLSDAVSEALATAEIAEELEELGLVTLDYGPEEMTQLRHDVSDRMASAIDIMEAAGE